MKTRSECLFLLVIGLTLETSLCASAFAGPGTTRPRRAQAVPAPKKAVYYVKSSASAIPKPISYINGGVMTTAVPIQIIGRAETVSR